MAGPNSSVVDPAELIIITAVGVVKIVNWREYDGGSSRSWKVHIQEGRRSSCRGGDVNRNVTGKGKRGYHHKYRQQPLGEFHQRHCGPCYQRNRGASAAHPGCTGYEGLSVATVMIYMSVKLGEKDEPRVLQTVNPPQLRRASASSSGSMRHLPRRCPSLNTPTGCHHLRIRSTDTHQHLIPRGGKRGSLKLTSPASRSNTVHPRAQ